jgi:hypothetical protein
MCHLTAVSGLPLLCHGRGDAAGAHNPGKIHKKYPYGFMVIGMTFITTIFNSLSITLK